MPPAVSEGEQRFREFADRAPVLFWTTGPDGMVDFINRGWLDFTGRTLDQELGDTHDLGVHPDDVDAVRSTWWRALRRRVPWEREYRLLRHDGEYRWIVDRAVPRFDGDQLEGYVGSAVDIHERKEMERKLSLAYERDHEVAETLQRSLLPERLPRIDGLEIEARYLPAAFEAAIGGDWYDAVELDDGRVALVVGDVVGHGLRAATVMGELRNAFRAYTLVESSPARILWRLNRLLCRDERDLMATALCVVLDRDTGQMIYANAGHPPALIFGDAAARLLDDGRSVPLGTTDPVTFVESGDRIEPDAVLMLYTDGLVELREVGLDDRLAQLVTVARLSGGELGDVCDQILSGVLGGRRPTDDVALLAVAPKRAVPGELSLRLPADPRALAPLRRRLERFLITAGASERDRFEVALSIGEAAMNAIEHAYGPVDAEFSIEIRVQDGDLSAVVRDAGRWRERRGGDRGRGLIIMRELMDDVVLESGRRGTAVTMRRTLPRPQRAAAGVP